MTETRQQWQRCSHSWQEERLQAVSKENELAANILDDSDLDLSVLWSRGEKVTDDQELKGINTLCDRLLTQRCDAKKLDAKTCCV